MAQNNNITTKKTPNSQSELRESNSRCIAPILGLIINSTTSIYRKHRDKLFSDAVHSTATPFDYFEHAEWFDFFKPLNEAWKIPSPDIIGGLLLEESYNSSMNSVLNEIRRKRSETIGVDGATNRLSKSVSNVIIHLPAPFFIEYLHSDLKRETSTKSTTR